eukprot:5061335-Pyramimonas_sp.AAC.1
MRPPSPSYEIWRTIFEASSRRGARPTSAHPPGSEPPALQLGAPAAGRGRPFRRRGLQSLGLLPRQARKL